MYVQENFGRQEQHLEQHYNDVLQTLSQRYDDRAAGLEEEKKSKLEALYNQLVACGRTLDASKELIEAAQELYRSEDKRLVLKVVLVFVLVLYLFLLCNKSLSHVDSEECAEYSWVYDANWHHPCNHIIKVEEPESGWLCCHGNNVD